MSYPESVWLQCHCFHKIVILINECERYLLWFFCFVLFCFCPGKQVSHKMLGRQTFFQGDFKNEENRQTFILATVLNILLDPDVAGPSRCLLSQPRKVSAARKCTSSQLRGATQTHDHMWSQRCDIILWPCLQHLGTFTQVKIL